MSSLKDVMVALRGWIDEVPAISGRTYWGVPPGLPQLPFVVVQAQANSGPQEYDLDGVCYRVQNVEVAVYGRSTEDSMRVGSRILAHMTNMPPPAIIAVWPETSGTPGVDAEGRIITEHRASIAYQ